MTLEVTLAIDPAVVGRDRCAFVAERLVEIGGPMVGWQPDFNGASAEATFKFESQARLNLFVAVALAIPGVSLATQTQGSDNEQESC